MVLRGFNNDGHISRARSRKPSIQHVLAEVMSKGKPIRQYMALHGVELDMSQLQGVSGREIAVHVLDGVIKHIDSSEPISPAQELLRAQAINHLGVISVGSESIE